MKPILIIGNTTCEIITNIEKLPKVQEDGNDINQSIQIGGCAF